MIKVEGSAAQTTSEAEHNNSNNLIGSHVNLISSGHVSVCWTVPNTDCFHAILMNLRGLAKCLQE